MLVLWCPDWPVVAAVVAQGISVREPAAVFTANRVVACSAAARDHAVRRGMRRREAQSRCPELRVLENDPARDARMFEPIAAAVEQPAPGVEVVRPGMVALPARGPARAFGGEDAAAERLVEQVATEVGAECQVGIADGLFAASIAAKTGRIVEPGATAEFLKPLRTEELTQPLEALPPKVEKARRELVDLLRRMGIRTLGQFGALTEREVSSRFGAEVTQVHRLARGLDRRPPVRRALPPDLTIVQEFDPPLDRLDTAAFAARAMAERFHAKLSGSGLSCIRLGIHATTENAEELSRVWRCADPLTEHGVAERVRWQLEGWLRGTAGAPTAGVCRLELEPAEIVDGSTMQWGLWNGAETDEASTERASRAMIRVQGLLGPRGVFTPVLRGGRGPGEQVQLVCWGDERQPDTDPLPPWPGCLPEISPATVLSVPAGADVLDQHRRPVAVSGRHELSAPPCSVTFSDAEWSVRGWAGPWPVDQRWWSADACRAVRVQLLCARDEADDIGLLLLRRNGLWTVEGVYD
jgi:protein ImuB